MSHPDDRPRWAAPTIAIAPSAMTDAEMNTSRSARVLVADWQAGTLSLRFSGSFDEFRCTYWGMPRLPAAVIEEWLPGILPHAQDACAALVGEEDWFSFDEGAIRPMDAIFEAVDALTQTWCGRPAPRGSAGRCRWCDLPIELSPRTKGLWAAVADGPPLRVRDRCEAAPDRSHFPYPASVPGHARADFRPFHDFEITEGEGGLFTGRCTCGAWRNDQPTAYGELGIEFDRHAAGPAPGAPFSAGVAANPDRHT